MCLNPFYVSRETIKSSGEVYYHFVGRNVFDNREDEFSKVECIPIPCRNCVDCQVISSNEWTNRCMLELKRHSQSCMITLTYAGECSSVVKADVQFFIQDLRNYVRPQKIRYFACGEYGKLGQRPHYHIIVFGWRPDDLAEFFVRDGHKVYLSDTVSDLWGRGYITVEDVSRETCRYTAKYLQKLNPPPEGCTPAFLMMSLKPPIGYTPDLVRGALSDGKIYLDGNVYPIPKSLLKSAKRRLDVPDVIDGNRKRKSDCLDFERILLNKKYKYKNIIDAQKKIKKNA
ncbi:replication initiator protein [Dipodfec virus UOA04_Rod_986]|nr:replication initiator protein [Dipodfec virus UOA04_Rod_986]